MDQKILIKYLSFFVINTIVVLFASVLFMGNVVLGNATTMKLIAAIYVGLVLTLGMYVAPSLAKKLDLKIKLAKDTTAAINFFVSNLILLWVVKRLADFTGLGISNIGYVIVLAAAFTIVQVFLEKYVDKLNKKAKQLSSD